MNEIDSKHISIDRFNHIIFKPLEFKIDTPAIDIIKRKIHQWLWCGITGAVILGHSRSGKTTAIEMIKDSFRTRNNDPIPSLHLTIPARDMKTIASIYRLLCISTGFHIKERTNTDEMASQMIHHLAELSLYNDDRLVILFVDEVQRLSVTQLHVFAEMTDALRDMKVTLYVFFVGNSRESNSLLKYINLDQNDHIRGRFFTQNHCFKGISSEKDVNFCLKQYDIRRFPYPDSPTYTQFFLDEEFEKGFRLASLSKPIWRSFREHQKQIGINEWGAKYFIGAVNPLLTDYLPTFGTSSFEKSMFDKCIEISGIISSSIELTQ